MRQNLCYQLCGNWSAARTQDKGLLEASRHILAVRKVFIKTRERIPGNRVVTAPMGYVLGNSCAKRTYLGIGVEILGLLLLLTCPVDFGWSLVAGWRPVV